MKEYGHYLEIVVALLLTSFLFKTGTLKQVEIKV